MTYYHPNNSLALMAWSAALLDFDLRDAPFPCLVTPGNLGTSQLRLRRDFLIPDNAACRIWQISFIGEGCSWGSQGILWIKG